MENKFDYKKATVEIFEKISVKDIYPKGIPEAPKGWEYYSFGNKGKKGDKYLYYDSKIYPLGYALDEDRVHENNRDGQRLWLRPILKAEEITVENLHEFLKKGDYVNFYPDGSFFAVIKGVSKSFINFKSLANYLVKKHGR